MSHNKAAVRKAVIPIAGLGTRHFPASHAVKKEMFPVVGADGIAQPFIDHAAEKLCGQLDHVGGVERTSPE